MLLQARVINFYEEKILYPCIYIHYYNYIRKNCNPLIKTYTIMLKDILMPKNKVSGIHSLLLSLFTSCSDNIVTTDLNSKLNYFHSTLDKTHNVIWLLGVRLFNLLFCRCHMTAFFCLNLKNNNIISKVHILCYTPANTKTISRLLILFNQSWSYISFYSDNEVQCHLNLCFGKYFLSSFFYAL